MNRSVRYFLPKPKLQQLLDELWQRGYTVLGPQVDQAAIVYGELRTTVQLPWGWGEEQEPGKYRLVPGDPELAFQYAVGPHSWKRYLFPPLSTLLRIRPAEGGWTFEDVHDEAPRYAMVGVRACELAAIRVQDRVFAGGEYKDPIYEGRRRNAFLIAVNCTHPAATCFCTSMKTGPRCDAGFDLSLTELPEGFLCEIGTDIGAELLEALDPELATDEQSEAAENRLEAAEQKITRTMNTEDLKDLLQSNPEDRAWDGVAERCLSCTNCTMVCPTCFCSSVTEVSDLLTGEVERQRTWDSCFNPEFSYMNGCVIRNDIRSRYRQWLTHKLGSWHDQFGMSGCVGCGRCITWCPVGIDLTAEVAILQGDRS